MADSDPDVDDSDAVDETDTLTKAVNQLTYSIIGAAQKVHRALGPGFGEAVYHVALARELRLREIPFESEKPFKVHYEGALCGMYKPDMVVCESIIVELKAVSELAKEHRAQAVSYLKASGLKTALLLNFGGTSLEVRRLRN